MTTELHLTYLCVPVTETVSQLDWKRFEAMLSTLTVRACGCTGPRALGAAPAHRNVEHALAWLCMACT